ncbi:MAG: MBL fold metallo-hydrolase [Bacteroidota bacterium]
MKIHHLRNATFVIETKGRFILVDPMLGAKGTAMPLSFFRFDIKRNPLTYLPENTSMLLNKVTNCLITHLHKDHIDTEGARYLRERQIPVICNRVDRKKLQKRGINVEFSLVYDQQKNYCNGTIKGIKAVHGYGFVKRIAGEVMGFYLKLFDDCSIYISSDTVYTTEVGNTLLTLKPDVTVLAAGMAQLDVGEPLLMNEKDMIRFVRNSPGLVYANHMEALNHCPYKRVDLRTLLASEGLLDKVVIPGDGEMDEYIPY